MAKKPVSESVKTYILELKNGDTRKITVPAHLSQITALVALLATII